jgi:4-diphosphocytidyl-2-C-methyl-D-erythritol kinase
VALKPLVALAPAKLNVCLYVGPRRRDGLHEICSLFQSITLADEVRLTESETEDEVVCPGVRGRNLAALALAGFRERFGWRGPPVRITIEKRIPIAAGLGGGSADAAAVLRLALAASGKAPPREELMELAMSLGADVPSQLEPGLALVRGAGELVERLELGGRVAFVLLAGVGRLSTAEVYTRADELGLEQRDLEVESGSILQTIERSATTAGQGGAAALVPLVHNDLQPSAAGLEAAVPSALALLHEAGALAAQVSGSGPAAFGIFRSGIEAEGARRELAERWPGETVLAASVDSAYGEPSPFDTTSSDRSGIGQ